MLPDIENKKWCCARGHRCVGVVVSGHVKLTTREIECRPSAAKMTDGLALKLFEQPFERSKPLVYEIEQQATGGLLCRA